MDVRSGATREIAPQWDRSADGIVLSADGKTLYTGAQDTGEHPLFAVTIADGQVSKLVAGGTVGSFDVAGNTVAFTRNTLHSNDQVFTTTTAADAPQRAITPSFAERVAEVGFGDYEQFSFAGWNNETVHGYVVKPWNYEAGKKYPVAFLIHGGPQGSFGNSWSQRWNPQTYAGQGYAVVMIDFHGSTGYGQAFTDAISQHWGDRPLEDLQKGWAAAQAKYDFIDGGNACALGASYGGYMINWIASQWNDGFKCLVNHNGVFDTRSMGAVTEETWFTEWEFGGPLFSHPQGYEAFNPARHIDKWQTPMLVVAGQNDFRVPLDQSLSTFHTLQRRGIESQLLYFPDENHWVLKPHNSIQWHDTVNAWLEKHLGQ
jgi:dipeptidyl aminopeptidase/acylaminoacyl peptidase